MDSPGTDRHHAGPPGLDLDELAARIRVALRGARPEAGMRPVDRGVGDFTYGLDRLAEVAAREWAHERAARAPLSILTEDAGWRHLGPDGEGGVRELAGFDHGGPRLVLDPVDGTRNLMADLRSAWTVAARCGPGSGEPRLAEVEEGLVAELAGPRASRYRLLRARRGAGAHYEEREVAGDRALTSGPLRADDDDRVDHGYFPFFRYTPAMRPLLARLEEDFFARLERHEGADSRHCFDDQYISNGGQLVLLSLGTYRFVADLRAALASRVATPCTTSKPYDCAGALLVAREAGCVLTGAEGAELDFPLDAATPVAFVGYANRPTAERLAPHLRAALASLQGPSKPRGA